MVSENVIEFLAGRGGVTFESLKTDVMQAVYDCLNTLGSVAFFTKEYDGEDNWSELRKIDDEYVLDLCYAPIVKKWLEEDKGLHVVTKRDDDGLITTIIVTLE